MLWKLAKSTLDLVGWKPLADVPSPNGKSDRQTRPLPTSRLRGRWFDFRGRRLIPTFHPSYLLRTPSEKKLAWEDIKLVMQALDLPLPKTAKPRA